METPPVNSKTKTERKEDNPVFSAYLDMIKNRHHKVRFEDLLAAYEQGLLNKEEFDSLHSKFTLKLENIAGIDHLTKVPTRTYMEPQFKRLKIELNHTEKEHRKFKIQSIMVLSFDVDDFKRLNDTYGHDVGDEALLAVVERIKRYGRINDTVFRVGGDEFVAILPIDDENPLTAEMILNRIKQDMNKELTVQAGDEKVSINVSVGCAVLKKGEDTTLAELLKNSDKNMYEDKKKK